MSIRFFFFFIENKAIINILSPTPCVCVYVCPLFHTGELIYIGEILGMALLVEGYVFYVILAGITTYLPKRQ